MLIFKDKFYWFIRLKAWAYQKSWLEVFFHLFWNVCTYPCNNGHITFPISLNQIRSLPTTIFTFLERNWANVHVTVVQSHLGKYIFQLVLPQMHQKDFFFVKKVFYVNICPDFVYKISFKESLQIQAEYQLTWENNQNSLFNDSKQIET
jgi:hypothetical protein